MDPRQLDELARRVTAALPEDIARLGEDARENLHAGLAAALARMDLVGREEFDVQSAVLARTREKVERLEARVQRLERAVGEDDVA